MLAAVLQLLLKKMVNYDKYESWLLKGKERLRKSNG